MRKYLVRGGNTYPKARSCPNGRQHTDIKMSCRGTVVCMLTRTLINMKWLEHLTLVWTGLQDTVTSWPLNLCFIYLLIIIYLCTTLVKYICMQHHHWYYYTYIHTHDIPFFWIAVYLWWRYLKFLLSILKLFVLADNKGSTS